MTIKQQGGVFGRNPTFNDVTVEGGLSVDGSTYTNFKENGSDIGSVFVTDDKIGIGTLNNGIAFDQSSNIILPFNPQTLLKRDGELDLGYAAGKFKNLYLSGNVVVDSGKGIDFSATSGTGTSELFDDYEEGTWTPAPSRFTGGGITATYNTQAGYYTKVGNLVTCSLYIDIASISSQGSSLTYIDGLPYAPARSYYDAGATGNNTGIATVDVVSFVAHSDSRLYLRQSGNTAANSSADWAAGALSGTITYMTS